MNNRKCIEFIVNHICGICLFIIFFSFNACQNINSTKKSEIKELDYGSNAAIIRNEISADRGSENQGNMARIQFVDSIYNFGTISEGKSVSHSFGFVNAGKTSLLIIEARSTCGCTVPEWPQQAIVPGDSGVIKVVFNSTGKFGYQHKPVSVYANTYPNETVVHLKGIVNKN